MGRKSQHPKIAAAKAILRRQEREASEVEIITRDIGKILAKVIKTVEDCGVCRDRTQKAALRSGTPVALEAWRTTREIMAEISYRVARVEELERWTQGPVEIDNAREWIAYAQRIDQQVSELYDCLAHAAEVAENEFQEKSFADQKAANGELIALLAQELGIGEKFAWRIFETIRGDPTVVWQFLKWERTFVLSRGDLKFIRELFTKAKVAIPCGEDFDQVLRQSYYIAMSLDREFRHMPSIDHDKSIRFVVAAYHLAMSRMKKALAEFDA